MVFTSMCADYVHSSYGYFVAVSYFYRQCHGASFIVYGLAWLFRSGLCNRDVLFANCGVGKEVSRCDDCVGTVICCIFVHVFATRIYGSAFETTRFSATSGECGAVCDCLGQSVPHTKVVRIISQYAFMIYLMHWEILRLSTGWFVAHFDSTLVRVPLLMLWTLVVCIVLTKLISLLPFSQWIVGKIRKRVS